MTARALPVVPRRERTANAAALIACAAAVAVLAACSLAVGVGRLSLSDPAASWDLISQSRLPRTVALILAGAAMAICGVVMQMLTRNRFVEPSTAGTTESAAFGLLIATLVAPGLPIWAKMLFGTAAAVAGTALFISILRAVPMRNVLIVPLIGLMLGGIISSVTTFIAYQGNLSQGLGAWMSADLSGVVKGRYEMLWLLALVVIAVWIMADRFTVAGLGEDFTTNLGLNHRRVMTIGLSLVALATSVVVITVGAIPFLGLIVPNIVALFIGDNIRRAIPWVAFLGSGIVLACDIVGRLVRYPYEVPLGVVMGIAGSLIFLILLLKRSTPVD
ncbi:iron chelate uptake ABC transporter family permease subunit [Helcobacillus massiliensis]|uniref:ABC transporter permease n=1 Tax=Helcobacillus TaxID=1161125 RepID=UPI001EF42E93|nr:iron chelate uptake ABC transporter family permease subunit [Helcobacillus massiliensis]MCG7427185.1 iron chelate uptake ABC transporter family permease subunit [Helcobacillus sp. ACRRO]MCT1556791.1 iron chelate uptake ABC transporter family permease subunit [Helcobacillus massiliensis]MCT2035615.1 iron chelate uptake ABC transporter family permease subunit [Helcobacillus massiliensis]MCT2330933.1 iron chelate uptake ABC transporter family permease subunit [Helcobacillus massiliensis]MDK774